MEENDFTFDDLKKVIKETIKEGFDNEKGFIKGFISEALKDESFKKELSTLIRTELSKEKKKKKFLSLKSAPKKPGKEAHPKR